MGSKACLPKLDRHHSAGKETAGLKPLVSSSCFCFQIAPELEKRRAGEVPEAKLTSDWSLSV